MFSEKEAIGNENSSHKNPAFWLLRSVTSVTLVQCKWSAK